jgi:hypothetical protein
MPQQETTGLTGNVNGGPFPIASLSNLAELARQAYQNKRIKDCLDLTRAILLIDPENAEAHLMRSSIQSELYQDLENARALLRSAQGKDDSEPAQPPVQAAPVLDTPAETPEAIPIEVPPTPVVVAAPAPLEDSVEAALPPAESIAESIEAPARAPGSRWLKIACAMVFLVILVAGATTLRSAFSYLRPPSAVKAADTSAQVQNVQVDNDPKPVANVSEDDIIRTDSFVVTVPPPTEATTAATKEKSDPAANVAGLRGSRLAPNAADKPNVAATGTLALSSPTSVEIYRDNAYVGAVPVSLDLPAGTYTFEYRHGNLRKTLTHVVNGNETTKVMITFEVTVQINSKPWGEVFLEGTERTPLGQTPLSGVRVPIGGILSFENPAFPKKRYRITGNETGIQNVFP